MHQMPFESQIVSNHIEINITHKLVAVFSKCPPLILHKFKKFSLIKYILITRNVLKSSFQFRLFEIGDGHTLKDVFDSNNIEIYKRSKDYHLKEIAKKTGVPLEVRFISASTVNSLF